MADIFVSYTRTDREIVRCIVALLEAQGWSVWWDTRIVGGERWDATIEREITATRCVVVVWTPQSINREWVLVEAHHGHGRGILVPILIGVDKPPLAFTLIQARNLSGWNGISETPATVQFLTDVKQKLDGIPPPQPSTRPAPHAGMGSEAEREWRTHLDNCDDPGLLRAYAAKWETVDKLWSYKAQQKAAGLEATQRRRRTEGRIKIDAKVIQGAPEGWFRPGAGKAEWFKDIDIGPEMVVVPAGEFIMGSDGRDAEKPPHKVTIKAPFAVGRFAVTFDEWDAGGLPHKPGDRGWGRGRRPVIKVSWEDARSYAAWLSQKTGKEYRLLSETEWEYCCRAGTTTKYAFGDRITLQQAHFSEGVWRSAKQTVEVGRFPPNAWGLYDTHGNVGEWCEDNWHENYDGAPQDGSVWQGGRASSRVLRGGSWIDHPDLLRSAYRIMHQPDDRDHHVGFRLSRTL